MITVTIESHRKLSNNLFPTKASLLKSDLVGKDPELVVAGKEASELMVIDDDKDQFKVKSGFGPNDYEICSLERNNSIIIRYDEMNLHFEDPPSVEKHQVEVLGLKTLDPLAREGVLTEKSRKKLMVCLL